MFTLWHLESFWQEYATKDKAPETHPTVHEKTTVTTNGQFRNYKSSNVNRLESEVDQAMVICNLQEQLNHIQMQPAETGEHTKFENHSCFQDA